MKRIILAAAAALSGWAAQAQTYHDSAGTIVPGVVPLVGCASGANCAAPVSSSNPLPVSGTFNASFSGFQPSSSGSVGTPISAQTSVTTGSTQALPTGTVVIATNAGATNTAYCQLGSTASTSSQPIAPNGGWFAFTVGSATQLTCVTSTSTTTVNMLGGSGLPTGTGGGGGNGSSGGNASVGATGSPVPGSPSATYMGMTVGGALTGLQGNSYGALIDSPSGSVLNTSILTGSGTFGATAPGSGVAIGGEGSGNLKPIIQADSSARINISTATTTQLVAGSSGLKTYVTGWDVIAGGTGNITLEYGTQTTNPCDTGTTTLTGAYPLVAQAGISRGGALGAIYIVPAGNALCALTSAAVQMSGSVSYTQF
jgi:hypothetical protein